MPRLGGAIDLPQVNDPASPAAGRQFLYFKSDGLLYTKTPAGTVTAVGGGSTAANVVTSANAAAAKLTDAATAPSSPAVGDLWIDPSTPSVADATGGWASTLTGRLALDGQNVNTPPLLTPTGSWYSGSYNGTSIASPQAAANRVTMWPVYFARPRSIDRMAVMVGIASAGATARFGIWQADPTTFYPAAPVADSGVVDVSTTGTKEITLPSTLVLHGLYWLGAGCTSTTPSFTSYSTAMMLNTISNTTVTAAQANTVIFQALVIANALPTFTSTGWTGGTNPGTAIQMRAA